MKRFAIAICLGVFGIVTVARPLLASDGFPLPAGWVEHRLDPKVFRRAVTQNGPSRERHSRVYFAPERTDGFVANIVANATDAPIDRKIAEFRAYLSRDGRRLIVDRKLHCRGHVRGQLFEDVSIDTSGRPIDATHLEVGRSDATESYAVTYTRRGETVADPGALRSLRWLCDESFDTAFIDSSPDLLTADR